jgi:hypothetical protein
MTTTKTRTKTARKNRNTRKTVKASKRRAPPPAKALDVVKGGARSPSPSSTPRARESLEAETAAAQSFEERSLVCARILSEGRWDGNRTVADLAARWGVDRAAVSNYRRAGAVACASARGDLSEMLEDTLGAFRRQEQEAMQTANLLEGQRRFSTAVRYREAARQARVKHAEVAGLVRVHHTVSLEADPRFAGLYATIHASLEDLDRMRDAFVAEVAKLTGGVLPEVTIPNASAHVRDAVRRYEAEVGARKLAA